MGTNVGPISFHSKKNLLFCIVDLFYGHLALYTIHVVVKSSLYSKIDKKKVSLFNLK